MLKHTLALFFACSVVACSGPPVVEGEPQEHPFAKPKTPTTPKPSEPPGNAAEAGAPPAAKSCRYEDPFGPFTRIEELSSAQSEGRATLSADELTIIFERKSSTTTSLMIATRSAINQPFSAPRVALSTPGMQLMEPSLSADGLSLYYARSYSGGQDIQRARRASVSEPFTAGANLFFPNGTEMKDFYPFIKGDQLWFTRNTGTNYDIFRADKSGESFDTPFRIAELSTTDDDFGIVLSSDERAAYFTRSVTVVGERFYDTYVATRTSKTERFEEPRTVPELMQPGSVNIPSWLSPDGCRMYIASDRAGSPLKFDLYVTSRAPR
jgi:Tol biopolymer transport system component